MLPIQTTLRSLLSPLDWQRSKSLTTHSAGEAIGKRALSDLAGGSVYWHNPMEGSLVTFAKL